MTLQGVLQEYAEGRVEAGAEVGLQVAVLAEGEVVADVVAGRVDAEGGAPVTRDHLFFAGSTAKGVLSALTHVLVARGSLDYDTRVADVWPAFAAHGKGEVTVRHALLHQAGVPGLPADLTTEQLCDWEHMCAVLADEEPWWPAGAAMGYHAQTFGFLLGETLQRATGEPLAGLLRDHLTGPVGSAADVFLGVPEDRLTAVAPQQPPVVPLPEPPPGSAAARALPTGARPSAAFANRRDVLTACIPSLGTMSALGVARVYAGMLGHLDGRRSLSPERLAAVTALAFEGHDVVMDVPTRCSLGWSLDRPGSTSSRPGSTFGMLGANGSAAYADVDSGVAVAVMRNLFDGSLTTCAGVDDVVARHYPARR